MRRRALRVTLALLAVASVAGAAYLVRVAEQRTSNAREASDAFAGTRMAAIRDAMELRAAQQAYVASGQSESFWIARTEHSVETLQRRLSALASSAPSEAARDAVDGALDALQDFEEVDRRVRNYTSSGQKLLASDIIFSDGLDTSSRILVALDEAGRADAQYRSGAIAGARRDQLVALGGAVAIVFIVLLLLTPRPREQAVTPAAAVPPAAAEPARPPHHPELELRPSAVEQRRADPAPGRAAEDRTGVELDHLAAVCTELARLSDTNVLPAVLERAAAALDASGLVLWVADPDGRELVPVAAHGYPASVLSRLGTLQVDAENATAAAFRTCLVQTVRAGETSSGAIAAPLVTPAGCRGVISAEVRHHGETRPPRIAAASILAAQLATLVGPPAARHHDRSAAL